MEDPHWIYKEHTRVKHQLLQKYLEGWLSILGTRYSKLVIVDGFAGRGRYIEGEEGSPLIIMRIAQALHTLNRVSEPVCVFIEKNDDNYNDLVQVVAEESTKFPNVMVLDPYHGEFAEFVSHLKEAVDARIAPSFFFIDPFGFSGVPFNVIQDILSWPRTEVFITLMLRDIARFLASPNVESTMDILFGTGDWRSILQAPISGEAKERELRDLYVDGLRAPGRHVTFFRVCMDDKEQTLYYLVHVSPHSRGHRLMKEVMARQGPQGTFAYLGPADKTARIQARLIADEIPALRQLLLQKFAGRTLSYEQVQDKSCCDTESVDKDYRTALKHLEGEGNVIITRVTSKTQRGLSGADRVAFPAAQS